MSLWWIGPPAESLRLDDPSVVTEDQRVPRIIRAVVGSTFIEVACGGAHAMALTNDGRLFAWDWDDHGQCGLGHDLRFEDFEDLESFETSSAAPDVPRRGPTPRVGFTSGARRETPRRP